VVTDREDAVTAATMTEAGDYYATGHESGSVCAYGSTGPLFSEHGAHEGEVTAVSISPGGRFLVSAGSDRTLIRWDLEKLPVEQASRLESHAVSIGNIALSPSGRYIATGSGDNDEAYLWSADNGTCLATLRSFYPITSGMDSGPGGSRVWFSEDEREVYVQTYTYGAADEPSTHPLPAPVLPEDSGRGCPEARYPLSGACSAGELTIFSAPGKPIAWFPVSLDQLVIEQRSRLVVGSAGVHLLLLKVVDNQE
jgi:hypothetical protein